MKMDRSLELNTPTHRDLHNMTNDDHCFRITKVNIPKQTING